MSMLMDLVPWWARALAVLALMAACAGFGALKMHEHDAVVLAASESKYSQFVAETRARGDQAARDAKAADALNKANKEKADAKHDRDVAGLKLTIAGLQPARAERGATGGFVPQARGADGGDPRACYDRPELDAALRALDQDLQRIADEGSKAVVDLNAVKRKAQGKE